MREVISMRGYMMVSRRHLRGREVFVQSVGSRMRMFQRRGSALGNVSGRSANECYQQIPRNSTQLISISSLSPSADNGRSSSRARSTNGPVSAAACRLLNAVSSWSVYSMFH